jgi:DNA-directed RNA polymerase specialized sigma24 family protein
MRSSRRAHCAMGARARSRRPRLVARPGGRSDAADDLPQEVFQRAWQSHARYREEGHERVYLLRIADHLVVDAGGSAGRSMLMTPLARSRARAARHTRRGVGSRKTSDELTARSTN